MPLLVNVTVPPSTGPTSPDDIVALIVDPDDESVDETEVVVGREQVSPDCSQTGKYLSSLAQVNSIWLVRDDE